LGKTITSKETAMKPLNEVCPDPEKVLLLEPEKLGHHVLDCLSGSKEPNIERATIAKTLASDYHQSVQGEISHAVEKAIDWLLGQCLLGASPFNKDLIDLTRPNKKTAVDDQSEPCP
jgi:hypothetical protein